MLIHVVVTTFELYGHLQAEPFGILPLSLARAVWRL